MATFVKVATVTGLKDLREGKLVEADGQGIALFVVDGSYYAIDNTCTHAGCPLAEGELEGEVVTCPCHGSQFNVKTGAVLAPPATQDVKSFPIRVTGNDVELEIG